MKNLGLIFFLLGAVLTMSSCKKETMLPTLNVAKDSSSTNNGILLAQGTFKSGEHTTSGTVKLYVKNNQKSLIFENFRTDNGPDLFVYLSKDTGISEFVSLGMLPGNGSFIVNIPDNTDTDKHSTVLIWCKQFSVNFGYSSLVK